MSLAEVGGGIGIAAVVAMLLGANPFAGSPLPGGAARADGLGLVVWLIGLYGLLGVSADRIRLHGWSRRSAWWPAPLLRLGQG